MVFGLIAAGFTSLGLLAVAGAGGWMRRNVGLMAAVAAGALITVSILHLAPEALAASASAPAFMLAGFAAGYLLHRVVLALAPATDEGRAAAAATTPVAAIALHSFVDGAAYTITFAHDFAAGALTALGLMLHEVPEGVIVFILLQRAGVATRPALGIAFLAAAATTPLGAAATLPIVAAIDAQTLAAAFAATAGMLLYVAAGHLLPHVEREPAVRAVPALAMGVALAAGAVSMHDHDHHGHDHDHAGHAAHAHAADDPRPIFAAPPPRPSGG